MRYLSLLFALILSACADSMPTLDFKTPLHPCGLQHDLCPASPIAKLGGAGHRSVTHGSVY